MINEMKIRTYISINYYKCKQKNAPIKRHRVAEWIQKQDMYICCLKDTSDLKTQIENKWTEKDIPCKWKSKESLGSYIYIRQNRL